MTAEQLAQQPRQAGTPLPLSAALDLAIAAVAESAEPPLARAGRWRVEAAGDGIEVRAVINTHLPVATQRLTRIAAGPALLAVRLAVAVSGFRPFTTLLPDPRRPRLLAVLRRGAVGAPSQVERALFAELVRGPGSARMPAGVAGQGVLPLLRRAADAEGVWMRTVSDRGQRERLLAVRTTTPPRGSGVGDQDLLIVIGSHGELPAGDLRAGQAMQRALLNARSLGLRASVFAGPAELATLRRSDVPGAGPGLLPQVALQIGPARADPRP